MMKAETTGSIVSESTEQKDQRIQSTRGKDLERIPPLKPVTALAGKGVWMQRTSPLRGHPDEYLSLT